jgi:AcrR family transcriptional regulator
MMGISPERADAARNREAILRAAAELFDREGVEKVSMSDIAAAAGVGNGTVFRRFGDKTALIEAVLKPRVHALMEALRSGPPPLGPGGEPADSLHACLDALFDLAWTNRQLIRALEHRGPHAYYANDVSRFWIAELRRRVALDSPDGDADYLAHALFTAIRADIVEYLINERSMTLDRVREGLHSLV